MCPQIPRFPAPRRVIREHLIRIESAKGLAECCLLRADGWWWCRRAMEKRCRGGGTDGKAEEGEAREQCEEAHGRVSRHYLGRLRFSRMRISGGAARHSSCPSYLANRGMLIS